MRNATIPPLGRQFECSSEGKSAAYKRIEAILEKAGPVGVHKAHFLYDLRWPQHQARICEMNDLGWAIESVPLPKPQWVSGIRTKYVLRSKPLEASAPTPASPSSESDYMRRVREDQNRAMPLFAGGRE